MCLGFPRVSIIIPIFNIAEYLPDCLDSVLGQTFVDFEVLLVDDGSTDAGAKICRAYNDDRFRYFYKENGGLSDARNFGMQYVRGEYIYFMDGDDCISPDYINELYLCAIQTKCDVVANLNVESFTSNGKREPFYIGDAKDGVYRVSGNYPHLGSIVWNKLFKASFLKRSGLGFVLARFNEDVCFYYHWLARAESFAVRNQGTYYYRQRKNSITWALKRRGNDLCDLDNLFDVYEYCKNAERVNQVGLPLYLLFSQEGFWGPSREYFQRAREVGQLLAQEIDVWSVVELSAAGRVRKRLAALLNSKWRWQYRLRVLGQDLCGFRRRIISVRLKQNYKRVSLFGIIFYESVAVKEGD